jgi:hypothetical protein
MQLHRGLGSASRYSISRGLMTPARLATPHRQRSLAAVIVATAVFMTVAACSSSAGGPVDQAPAATILKANAEALSRDEFCTRLQAAAAAEFGSRGGVTDDAGCSWRSPRALVIGSVTTPADPAAYMAEISPAANGSTFQKLDVGGLDAVIEGNTGIALVRRGKSVYSLTLRSHSVVGTGASKNQIALTSRVVKRIFA